MLIKRSLICAFLLSFFAPLMAQNDAEMMGRTYADAYDSLLSTYYMRKFPLAHVRSNQTFNVEAFDRVPDSVISSRLRSLHTVIPMTYNSEVRSYIRMYLRYMSTRLDVMTSLCAYYHPLFEEVLTRNGVPEELKYLTIVESAMNPMATSRVGAAGLWQFMYYTGKLYDMEVNSVVDDRRDPYRSTLAAARYLKDLHTVFNDWTLAIAAYNCGPGNINKAIARSGGRTDFWEIYPYLPRETRGYIPAFIGAIYVMKFHDEHGLYASSFDIPLHTDTVTVRNDVLFHYVSQSIGVEMDELRQLNPQYRADFIPGSSRDYTLCLPLDRVQPFIFFEDSIYAWTADSLTRKPVKVVDDKSVSSSYAKGSRSSGNRYHTVRRGETLTSIARKYGTTVSALKKKNKIRGDRISAGQKIRVK